MAPTPMVFQQPFSIPLRGHQFIFWTSRVWTSWPKSLVWDRTSARANSPMRVGSCARPAPSCHWPNISRPTEETGSGPTMAMMRPMMADMKPLTRSLAHRDTTTQRPMTPMAKYSHAPNTSAILASRGAMTTRQTPEKMPPMAEENTPMSSASPARPCFAMGEPSKVVAMEAGVPGIFSRIAEIKPPEMEPTYTATSSVMPFTSDME